MVKSEGKLIPNILDVQRFRVRAGSLYEIEYGQDQGLGVRARAMAMTRIRIRMRINLYRMMQEKAMFPPCSLTGLFCSGRR